MEQVMPNLWHCLQKCSSFVFPLFGKYVYNCKTLPPKLLLRFKIMLMFGWDLWLFFCQQGCMSALVSFTYKYQKCKAQICHSPLSPQSTHTVSQKENRSKQKWFAKLLLLLSLPFWPLLMLRVSFTFWKIIINK